MEFTSTVPAWSDTLKAQLHALSQQHPAWPSLSQWALELDCRVVETIASTNSALLAALPLPATLLWAKTQSAGRGRGGKAWHSAHQSLTFSLALPFLQQARQHPASALVVGVACVEALAELGVSVQLKWPNDLLWQGRKLAGILLESSNRTPHHCVIGIGLNVSAPALDGAVGLTELLGRSIAADALLLHLVPSVLTALAEFDALGFAPFIPRWQAYHANAHQIIRVRTAQDLILEGKVEGVDAVGRLLLRTREQIHALSVAEYQGIVAT